MSTAPEIMDLVEAHSLTPVGMAFYSAIESFQNDAALLGYVSVIERAWIEMELSGVLCLDGRPILYLKQSDRPISSQDRIRLQKLFWNQGVANILVLADPATVYIYSGLAKPPNERSEKITDDSVLVETLNLAEYVQRIHTFHHDLATGHYYEKYNNKFNPEQSVDSLLLKNLCVFRDLLSKGDESLDIKVAHAFLGRMLFLCYLLDREIVRLVKPEPSRTATSQFADLLKSQGIDYLYTLFGELKEQFNGNMFDQDLDVEKLLIRPKHIERLIDFLEGHELESGQRTLPFWPYDFKMIPVETISAIYQDFLSAEDPQEQRKRGAFYTPRFLAEMVVDVAIAEEKDAFSWSYLDGACGSGIFLVILFNRLAKRWILDQKEPVDYLTKARALQAILEKQIRGVDVEEAACRIACFSLYLAYLDFFEPPDIQNYRERTGKPLPKLLHYGNGPNRPSADISVIYKADFLAEETLSGQYFDCIIGNPPWEGRQSKQLAQKFMEKAPRILKNGGVGCLLLPTKILQNQTDAFQAQWLKAVTLQIVLQLADYRRLLFENAKTPAFIARFKNLIPQADSHAIEFIAPKFNREGLRKGVITVNPASRTWMPLSDILAATQTKTAPMMWKRHLWGTSRDQKLLDILQSLPPLSELAGKPTEGRRWVKGQGFQPYYPEKAENDPNYPEPIINPWSPDDLFIGASQYFQMIAFQPDCIKLLKRLEDVGASSDHLRRVPHERLFRPPMVLVSKGFSKVAYCDFKVLFDDALRSISGPVEDAELLMFLTAYLRSRLARYFLFHTTASWGAERDQVHLSEVLRVPFPVPGHEFISPDAGRIVEHVAQKIGKLRYELQDMFSRKSEEAEQQSVFYGGETYENRQWQEERKKRVDALQKKIEPLIYRYFGLTEQEINLVEDTVRIIIPSSTPTTWRSKQTVTLDPVQKTSVEPYASQVLAAYADTLTATLNTWAQAEGSDYRIRAEGGVDDNTGLAMVTLHLSNHAANFQQVSISPNLSEALKKYQEAVRIDRGTITYERDILFFEGERIHIIRPNILLNWTRTAALNDAAKIYGDIALAERPSHDLG